MHVLVGRPCMNELQEQDTSHNENVQISDCILSMYSTGTELTG